MKKKTDDRTRLILDASVLIDFCKADRSVLELIVKHVGPVNVISPIVDEVHEIEIRDDLLDMGVVILEPELEDVYAVPGGPGPLSFPDWLCLLTAKRWGFVCATNDKILRRECEAENIPLMWGLQLLIELHQRGAMGASVAMKIATQIHLNNPKHISIDILKRFKKSVARK